MSGIFAQQESGFGVDGIFGTPQGTPSVREQVQHALRQEERAFEERDERVKEHPDLSGAERMKVAYSWDDDELWSGAFGGSRPPLVEPPFVLHRGVLDRLDDRIVGERIGEHIVDALTDGSRGWRGRLGSAAKAGLFLAQLVARTVDRAIEARLSTPSSPGDAAVLFAEDDQ